MIFLKLFISFFKIGLFSFGGGYAMIPLIQSELEANNWLSSSEFIDIIAIAEMTPGPIAVNSATFVGYKAAGFWGGIVATFGVALPSLLLILIISNVFFKFQKHPLNIMIFYGIRPVIAGLILSAAIVVAKTAFFHESVVSTGSFGKALATNPLSIINFEGAIIFVISLIALIKFKLHPILVLLGSGAIGVLFYYIK
ncbi:chromate transporter [Clostridium swellfunianum]|uniref:chromate transporter n=1 Tax=Clostridium swellfunianum TaxID=1367462 RepID=UPI00202E5C1B|nr:chromate transporter [Clostridium swellfunianum]MCM0649961.1 chromate transporter [Clostridium swellfunianum]